MCCYQQIKEHSKKFQSKWSIEIKILSFIIVEKYVAMTQSKVLQLN
jgi:hypothetical protein